MKLPLIARLVAVAAMAAAASADVIGRAFASAHRVSVRTSTPSLGGRNARSRRTGIAAVRRAARKRRNVLRHRRASR